MRSEFMTVIWTVLIVLFSNVAGAALVSYLYRHSAIDEYGVEIGWITVATGPAACIGLILFTLGKRSGYWWGVVLLPGILVWFARPWVTPGPQVEFIWAHTYLADYTARIFPAFENNTNLPPHAIAGLVGFLVILTLTAMVIGAATGQSKKHFRQAVRAGGRTAGIKNLPQASWAEPHKVRERFSHPGGIVLGEYTDPVHETPNFRPDKRQWWTRDYGKQGRGRLITMDPTDGNGHVLVTSQASGYKSTGIVMPNILNYQGPLVVFDPKCELYARTAQARRDMGFNPIVIDSKNGYDPAQLIALLARKHPAAYLRMAKMMIPRGYGNTENAQYFKDAAIALFTGLLAHFAETGSSNIIGDVANVLSLSADEVHETISEKFSNVEYGHCQVNIQSLQGIPFRNCQAAISAM